MRTLRITTLALCVCGLLCSCSSREEAKDPRTRLAEHKARRLPNWRELRDKDFAGRILPAPDVLLDYLRLGNNTSGRVGFPVAPLDWKSFARDVQAAIDEFPSPVRRHLQDHAVGIFLVKDLGSSGYAELLADFPEHNMGLIVLDVSALDMPANAWATRRQATPFKPSGHIKTTVQIAGQRKEHRKQAISLILLHELGHLVGAARRAHWSWWTGGEPSEYPFAAISWVTTGRGIASRWDGDFKDRHKVRFYAPTYLQLPAGSAEGIYSQLLKTDFVTLYASTSVYEDFAETYAMYVHVVMQGRPWALELQCDGTTRVVFGERIMQAGCKEKRQYIADLMRGKSR
jgi:hypothetical protein